MVNDQKNSIKQRKIFLGRMQEVAFNTFTLRKHRSISWEFDHLFLADVNPRFYKTDKTTTKKNVWLTCNQDLQGCH